MMNHSTGRTGRLGALSIGSPEILCSVTMFMSCTLCNRRLARTRGLIAAQMRSNCGVVKSDTPQEKLTELPLEVVRLAVSETRRGRQPGQRSGHHGVMRKPEQVERFAVVWPRVPRGNRTLKRGDEGRPPSQTRAARLLRTSARR